MRAALELTIRLTVDVGHLKYLFFLSAAKQASLARDLNPSRAGGGEFLLAGAQKLAPRTVAGIAPLLNTMLRTFDPIEVERRLQQLETAEAKRTQLNSGSSD
jgi:hypothetical protein